MCVCVCVFAIIHTYLNGLSPSYPGHFSPCVRIKVMCLNVAKRDGEIERKKDRGKKKNKKKWSNWKVRIYESKKKKCANARI